MSESKKPDTEKTKEKSDKDESSGSSDSANANADDDDDQIGRGVGTAKITVNREEYLQAYRDLINESKQLQMKNNILHRRLAEHYKKRKCEHVLKPFEGAADLEEKYTQKLMSYENLKEASEKETADLRAKITTVENQFLAQHEHAESKFAALQAFERTTGTGLIFSAKGKPIPDKTVSRFLSLQNSKWQQASALYLRYVRARNAVAELEAIVRKLEVIGPGLYVCEYEQLNIDNQNYSSKIEERQDELVKNRSKCTEHNQMLAHIREKMHHTEEVTDSTECDLGEAELEFTRAREDLGAVKAQRNKLRSSLEVEKLKAGLLTRKDLLRDFQDASDGVMILRQRKEELKAQIENINKKLRAVRQSEKLHME
ncbi:unnamed protein product [Arctia plantaginis]|uniref:CCDC113/CCDC96 coiled-coil domain-containing protein n=1 Tax=Arctia plantaginis TaxID=874455 RepID=A0A8S0YVH2_ARCPL|nr:unnamed protein product [Arctia plantaginis]CAB3253509.1 unnamed protein product [Arctia plantaginis]